VSTSGASVHDVAEQTELPTDGATNADDNPYRLPRTVVPRRYELVLEPDLSTAGFTGSVTATVDVVEPTRTVVLNAAELEIQEAWVEPSGNGSIDPATGQETPAEPPASVPEVERQQAGVSLDEDAERVTLTLPHEVPPGPASVHLRFRGTLNDKLRGFYRSSFKDDDGAERVLAATQMEATHARRAFPCWDEPDLKAVFGVTLVVPDDLLAVSNGAEVARIPSGEGRVAIRFSDTIPMSTYLVAFIVGPLEATAPVDVDGTPLRIIHPPNRGHLTPYALDAAAFTLRYFTEWFAIPYPGDKLDLVAIPDFAFGAMENLGCVTFRERLLLIDPEASTHNERLAVVDVIAHELAHMWFGDLVTMKWWNGIWLNEAFATFMEMLATDAYRPDWQRWVSFGVDRSPALDTDALGQTRPIEYPVVSPDDAEGMFDVLTYQKGAAVVRMLEQYLGAERFRNGIRRYMNHHRYGNTETSDLWDALEEETGEPARRIAESWIFQKGFPAVAVQRLDERVTLSQRRFRYVGAEASRASSAPDGGDEGGQQEGQEEGGSLWAIPMVLDIATADGDRASAGRQRVLLDRAAIDIDVPGRAAWINANAGANGFYRVHYSPEALDHLVAARRQLSPLERYVVVDDAWAAVLAGPAEASGFLQLAEGFADEDDLSVWERLVGGLSTLERLVDDEPRRRFADRVRGLLRPVSDRLGTEPKAGDDDRTRTLRGLLLGAAALLGDDPAARKRSRELLDAYLGDPGSVEASLGTAALHASAALGDLTLHRTLVERFREAQVPQERERILSAFGRFRDAACLSRTLELALSGELRSQDAPYVLRETIANRDNAHAAWSYVVDHWDQITERFPSNSIPRLLAGIRTVRSRQLAEEIAAFLERHPVPQGEMQVRQHVERMWVTVALAEREADRFAAAI
jgi:puromycin-sensitive aminopeptidase